MAQPQVKTPPRTAVRGRKAPRARGALLECPICKHDDLIRAADLIDGRELRCNTCKSELVVALDYDEATGRTGWELRSLEDDYDDDQP